MEKVKTGIEKLDTLLYGGFPKGRAYLISGEPGTGKTIFTLQFLKKGIELGEKCIYISIDEKPEHIIKNAESLGWDLQDYLNKGQLKIFDFSNFFTNLTIEDTKSVTKVIDEIVSYVKEHKATRLVIDPIAPLLFSQKSITNVSEYIRKLIYQLEETDNCTTLLTSYVPVGSVKLSQHGIEEFAASGIILLRLVKEKSNVMRTIWIRKIRGTKFDLSEYNYEILNERGIVLRQPV